MGSSGKEREDERDARHAEHISEVRAGGDVDVFERVGKGDATLADAVGKDVESLLQEHDIGRLLGDVDRRIDRDAHVGRVQCRGVVDPIAQVSDHVAGLPEGQQDTFLLIRLDLGEDRDLADPLDERLVAHTANLVARQDDRFAHTRSRAGGPSDVPVVARDDLEGDAEPRRVAEPSPRCGSWAGRGARGIPRSHAGLVLPVRAARRDRARGRPRRARETLRVPISW